MLRKPLIASVLATVVIGVFVYRVAFGYFVAEELTKAEGRLSVYHSTVVAELERYAHLTKVLSRDTYVMAAADGGDRGALNVRLDVFADQAGLDAIYLMNTNGETVAASNHAVSSSFVGHNYAFRPYFQDALDREQGRFYAIGSTTGLPGYFIADAVLGEQGETLGVIAVKKSLSELEQSWSASGEQVLVANQDGVVLLASNPAWRYRVLEPLSDGKRAEIAAARQFAGQELAALDWQARDGQRARIGGEAWLHLVGDGLPHGWALHYFASDDRAVARSWLATAVVVLLAGILLVIFQVQRARRIGRALRRAEQEEAQLRVSNAALAKEVGERKAAEERLQLAQNELERASRLAALGELSASVTHELGQPIAAMRNHLAAAEIGAGQVGPLVGEIGGLVDRMEGITRQLKFFASPQPEPFAVFDLRDAMRAALGLVAPNVEDAGVRVEVDMSESAVQVRGSKLRIEQVMTNVLRNAVDAIEESAAPMMRVVVGQSDGQAWFEVADNGHGLGPSTLQELQEPFVTTRASGRGMGLGLAISANIVKDHEGRMTARNGTAGGAVFRVVIPNAGAAEDAA
ncbi:sensor histidine kinase [Shimia abyssi]|uniref:histidine kinase n=1 Tax=Shimia abyssi TaxID=1662395 RepID=A0A2P8F6S9_9RHOB|nr:ATP-binding protein [Shimia abyssi]PSL17419.1 two-component system C4-dicarboxylate transport sensor histidine kinase DctB [Shimia abyssi]